MEHDYKEPVYTIGIAAKKLKVCQATIRIWEKKKLIKPARIGKDRYFSHCDLDRMEKIKDLIHKERINIEGVKKILQTSHCWEIKNCSPKARNSCSVYVNFRQARANL